VELKHRVRYCSCHDSLTAIKTTDDAGRRRISVDTHREEETPALTGIGIRTDDSNTDKSLSEY